MLSTLLLRLSQPGSAPQLLTDAEILLKAAHLLESRKEELAQTMTREMGKVIKEARGDVQEAIDMAKYMAGEGRRLVGQNCAI
jgi:acyl-CoA reductase-like NAD-dependent aldehyde dehydrogenase